MRHHRIPHYGTDTFPSCPLESLRPIPVPVVPPRKRIVAQVEQLMRLCDALEAALRRSEDRAAKLARAEAARNGGLTLLVDGCPGW